MSKYQPRCPRTDRWHTHRHMRPHCRIRTVGGAVYIFSVLSTRVTPPYATERPRYRIETVGANRQISTGT